MSNFYGKMQGTASKLLKKFNQGIITYSVETGESGEPWNPQPSGRITYTLDAVARGVEQKYVKEGYISASDIQVTAAVFNGSYSYTHTYIDSETGLSVTVSDQFSSMTVDNWFAYYFAPYNVEASPTISGLMEIDGKEHQIIEVQKLPAAGTTVAYRIFVKS